MTDQTRPMDAEREVKARTQGCGCRCHREDRACSGCYPVGTAIHQTLTAVSARKGESDGR